jgi:hypothetical protein
VYVFQFGRPGGPEQAASPFPTKLAAAATWSEGILKVNFPWVKRQLMAVLDDIAAQTACPFPKKLAVAATW